MIINFDRRSSFHKGLLVTIIYEYSDVENVQQKPKMMMTKIMIVMNAKLYCT